MHPTLFTFDTPTWLQGILPAHISIHGYGFLIALGALFAYLYVASALKKYGLDHDKAQNLFILLVFAGFVGGKLLFYLENPSYYFASWENMRKNMGNGFVFYGSLLFCVPVMLGFSRFYKLPTMQVLDIVAIGTCIVHIFGRMGCFSAGCCYGLPTDSPLGVVFSNPSCAARPLDTPLHPTQLYEVGFIGLTLGLLLLIKQKQRFDGQLFLLYIMLYGMGRSIIETVRGDVQRGFIIEGWLSHSQFISLLLVLGVGAFYIHQWKNGRLNKEHGNKAE